MTTATYTALGYRATRHEDGSLVVHDVPIFLDCERGDHQFDAQWISVAMDAAKQAEREGYLPPLHVRHHEPGVQPRPAGFFRITRTGPITYKGQRRTAMFADLVVTDEFVQREVMGKRLPYRSVEIFDVDRPRIDGLALLDHEAPFLELPMLMISDVGAAVPNGTTDSGWHLEANEHGAPLVASMRRGTRTCLLFRHEDPDMAAKTTQKPATSKTTRKPAQFGAGVNMEADDDKGGGEDEGGEKKEGEDMEGEAGIDVAAVCKAIADGSISVADMDAILAAIQSQQTTAEPEQAEQPFPGMAMKHSTDIEARFAALAKQNAELAGANKALSARIDATDAATKRRDAVAVAMKRLEGRPLGADLESELVAFHTKHGDAAFSAYVDAMVKNFGAIVGDGSDAEFTGAANVPEVAMAYQAAGTEAVDLAVKFTREYAELKNHGIARMSEERYVALNMERRGFRAPQKQTA